MGVVPFKCYFILYYDYSFKIRHLEGVLECQKCFFGPKSKLVMFSERHQNTLSLCLYIPVYEENDDAEDIFNIFPYINDV